VRRILARRPPVAPFHQWHRERQGAIIGARPARAASHELSTLRQSIAGACPLVLELRLAAGPARHHCRRGRAGGGNAPARGPPEATPDETVLAPAGDSRRHGRHRGTRDTGRPGHAPPRRDHGAGRHADRPGHPAAERRRRPLQPGGAEGPLAVGQQFGRYLIIRLLGLGGMGAVYQAWDAELEVAVAVKVIRPEVMADRVLARNWSAGSSANCCSRVRSRTGTSSASTTSASSRASSTSRCPT